MPTFPKGFSEDDYLELVARLKDVTSNGSFDANDLLWSYMEERDFGPVNAGSVAGVLTDLEGLGVIRRVGGNPPRWELVEDS